jgi:hypothetical protein
MLVNLLYSIRMNNDITELFQQLQNQSSIKDFEGLSPEDMHLLLYNTFEEISPLHLNLFEKELIPEETMVMYLWNVLNLIKENSPVKLTQAGYLPVALCRTIFDNNWIEDNLLKSYYRKHKLTSESKIPYIAYSGECCHPVRFYPATSNFFTFLQSGIQ